MVRPTVPPDDRNETRGSTAQHKFTEPAQPHQVKRAKAAWNNIRKTLPSQRTKTLAATGYRVDQVGANTPDMLKHTAADERAVIEALHGKGGIQVQGNPPPKIEDNPFMQVSKQLRTGVPDTFSTRTLEKGERIYARSDPNGRGPGQFSSPKPLGREEAVQGHALAWTGTTRDKQHGRLTTFEVTDSEKAGVVLTSTAAPQTHKQTGERLPGGEKQNFHASGLWDPNKKGLDVVSHWRKVRDKVDPAGK